MLYAGLALIKYFLSEWMLRKIEGGFPSSGWVEGVGGGSLTAMGNAGGKHSIALHNERYICSTNTSKIGGYLVV